jgi:2,4-dienoyl-CoA reductase-like NADH-dependent reductase (Old Yellow Enzyme family)
MQNEALQSLREPHWLGDLLLPNRVVMAPLSLVGERTIQDMSLTISCASITSSAQPRA